MEHGTIRSNRLLAGAAWFMLALWVVVGAAITVGVFAALAPLGLLPMALTVLGALFWFRVARMEVVLADDGLLVRNLLRSVRVSRADVERIEVGGSRVAWRTGYATAVLVLRGEARLDLDVCARQTGRVSQRRLLERDLDRLQAWFTQ